MGLQLKVGIILSNVDSTRVGEGVTGGKETAGDIAPNVQEEMPTGDSWFDTRCNGCSVC